MPKRNAEDKKINIDANIIEKIMNMYVNPVNKPKSIKLTK